MLNLLLIFLRQMDLRNDSTCYFMKKLFLCGTVLYRDVADEVSWEVAVSVGPEDAAADAQ